MKKFIRLYDENGNHLLSIVPCGNGTDIAHPDGKVFWCGKINEDDALNTIIENFPPSE